MARRGADSPLPAAVVTVVGARPQFIKAAALTPSLGEKGISEILVHTGQHYDWEMSAAFFEGFRLPEPKYNLQVGSAAHGAQTGRMLEALERVLLRERPAMVIVYGDTNSTLAGALAAAKLHIPVAHVEAGLRSFDRAMPEEINRVLTDHISELLFAPTEAAVANLRAEGITRGVVKSGDVMFDVLQQHAEIIESAVPRELHRFGVARNKYAFLTVHRAENTDDPQRWNGVVEAIRRLAAAGLPVIWPAHPRTAALIEKCSLPGVTVVPPLPYVPTQALVKAAGVVLTDSGGLQKEAAFQGTPCVVLRERTEWVELVAEGRVFVEGTTAAAIVARVQAILSDGNEPRRAAPPQTPSAPGIAEVIRRYLTEGPLEKLTAAGENASPPA